MSRQDQVGSHKTVIFTDDDGFTHVKYQRTSVVKFNKDKIILDSGGWRTPTTKTRMNQAANQFGLGFVVFQKDFEWFVAIPTHPGRAESYDWDNPLDFTNGMEISR